MGVLKMEYEFVFKVRVLDFLTDSLLSDDLSGAIGTVGKFKNKVDNDLGGLICLKHYHIPHVSCYLEHYNWILIVGCCCKDQWLEVEKRIKKTLN